MWQLASSCLGMLTVVALFAAHLHAQPQDPAHKSHVGKSTMNGYSLKQFGDFIKEWHFVTVRYRRDTGEMRLTYANDKAWKALQEGAKEYPDGAVFAKVGIMTQEDPNFVSSVEPMGARRYQLMVKDSKKHTKTDGWGYALFNEGGFTFEEDPEVQTQSCHACHQLVPERDYVFSKIMRLEVGKVPPSRPPSDARRDFSKIKFVTMKRKDLPAKLRNVVPENFSEVRVVDHAMVRNMFQGTIDEIRPTLGQEALRAKKPAVLVNEPGTRFSMVVPVFEGETCKAGEGKKGINMMAIYTIKPGAAEDFPLTQLHYCEAQHP
jgi:hypothetical protein